ncbi:MAG: peptidoglycan bridge formation glycyltransferase FemA/FemB family protein [Patescibacteria group bacterium]|jgi:lipid II:glycine glycyltransferase (peptidoglycan interpeptide bridge formation enzyme)
MNATQWNSFVLQNHGSFLQSWQWGEFQQAYGRTIIPLAKDNLQALCIVYPLRFNKTYLFSPYGPVGNITATTITPLLNDIKNLAKKYHAIHWRYERAGKLFSGQPVSNIHPQQSWLLPLTNPEQLLAAMKQKWRYNIHLAERKGVTIHQSTDLKDLEKIYPLLKNTAQRQKIKLHPKRYYTTMVNTLNNHNLTLYLAEYQNKIIAGNIMLGFGDTITYVHGGSDHAYHTVMAPHLLQWQAIVNAQQAGYKTYDFFGISEQWPGITRFKQGFGGQLVEYAGTYELPLNKMWYTAYKLAKLFS